MNVQVERWYRAPRETVFGAFADANFVEQWMRPSPEVAMRVKRFEFRPGGGYRFAYEMASGTVNTVMGEYLSIHPPSRLTFTWTWEAPDPNAGIETLVTIDFVEQDGGTRVVINHERFPDEITAQRHQAGWTGALARLGTVFPQPKSNQGVTDMNTVAQAMLQEFEQEAKTTRRCLERVPDDKLGWRPHEKSMSAGQLALHLATGPSMVIQIAAGDEFPIPEFVQPQAGSMAEVLAAFDQSVERVRAELPKIADDRLGGVINFTKNGATVMSFPRGAFLRSVLLNHFYHHRGQLSVYLRSLGAKVPSIYGPSADESPFG